MALTGDAKKEYQRDYMKHKRSNKEGLTEQGLTLLSRPNGADYNPEELLSGEKRYLGPLSDGQVLDKLTVNGRVTVPGNVGTKSGQHPFHGMRSVIFTPLRNNAIK